MKSPSEPPYRWRPLGTVRSDSVPDPGQIIAWRHEAWRVVTVNRVHEADWTADQRIAVKSVKPEYQDCRIPRVMIVRPARFVSNGDPVRDRNAQLSLSANSRWGEWQVYPSDHYPVCVGCGEPMPCRAEMARSLGEKADKDAARYEIPGVCPSCQETVTPRQKVHTFGENLRIPLGPPVTFHVGRGECRYDAVKYEQELAKSDPSYLHVLSCPGFLTQHPYDPYDRAGFAQCTESEGCGGPKMPHAGVIQCPDSCPRCQQVRETRAEAIAARNSVGDWTTW